MDKAGDVNGDGPGDVIVAVALLAPGGGSVFDNPAAISAPHVVFDSTDYVELGDNSGRRVYGRKGAYYGLEVSLPLLPFCWAIAIADGSASAMPRRWFLVDEPSRILQASSTELVCQ